MLVYFIVLTNIILPYCILFYYAEIFSALKASVSSLTNTEPVELGAPQVQVTKDSQKQNKLKASAQLGLIGLDAVLVLPKLEGCQGHSRSKRHHGISGCCRNVAELFCGCGSFSIPEIGRWLLDS